MLRARDGDRCRRCGFRIDFTRSGLDPLGPTVGHILAAAHGGTDDDYNLALEHRRCNLDAGAKRGAIRPIPPIARAIVATPIEIE